MLLPCHAVLWLVAGTSRLQAMPAWQACAFNTPAHVVAPPPSSVL